jgi:uncharacterized protein (DUF1330 family)
MTSDRCIYSSQRCAPGNPGRRRGAASQKAWAGSVPRSGASFPLTEKRGHGSGSSPITIRERDAGRASISRTYLTVAAAVAAGMAIGGFAVQSLHAQAKPKAIAVIEIEVTDEAGFLKEYAPVAQKVILGAGGKYLARGGKMAAIEGPAPKRLTIVEFESLDKAQAAFTSAAYKDARNTGDKYASKFHITAVEAAAQ